LKAQAILDGRPYEKIEDVMKVNGIKQGEFNKIKDLITVNKGGGSHAILNEKGVPL
jgi:hypothetical protein